MGYPSSWRYPSGWGIPIATWSGGGYPLQSFLLSCRQRAAARLAEGRGQRVGARRVAPAEPGLHRLGPGAPPRQARAEVRTHTSHTLTHTHTHTHTQTPKTPTLASTETRTSRGANAHLTHARTHTHTHTHTHLVYVLVIIKQDCPKCSDKHFKLFPPTSLPFHKFVGLNFRQQEILRNTGSECKSV